MHSHKHPICPTAAATASTKMLQRALSSRRPSLCPEDAAPNNDTLPTSGDESKTKRQSLSLLATNCFSRLTHLCPCPTSYLILCLLIVFFSIGSLLLHSRNFVCVSPFDPATQVRFFEFDGFESNFSALGVLWCKSPSPYIYIYIYIYINLMCVLYGS